MIRYTISAIKKDGSRQRALNNWTQNNWETEKEAADFLAAIIANTSPETIDQVMGADLRVDPVECYPTGDQKGTYIH